MAGPKVAILAVCSPRVSKVVPNAPSVCFIVVNNSSISERSGAGVVVATEGATDRTDIAFPGWLGEFGLEGRGVGPDMGEVLVMRLVYRADELNIKVMEEER
jgi:hypothetical protein